MFAAMAIAGGEAEAHVCEELATPAAISELLAAALVERHRRGDGVVYALSAPSLAGDVASALATFELTDRLAGVLLADARATPTALLAVSQSPTPPARREDLLALAASRARSTGLRSVEMDALFALAAHVPSRSSALLCRLERLTRDAGTSATHPQVLEWLDEAARSDPAVLPLALRRRAEKAARDGDAKGAASLVARAREAARASGDVAAEALTLASAGAIALYRADWAAADAALAEARARLASIDLHDAEEIARLDHNAGVIALYRGRVDEAVAAFERSLAAKRKIGDRGGMRSCLLNLGLALARAPKSCKQKWHH